MNSKKNWKTGFEFDEMNFGVRAYIVREVFIAWRGKTPSIIFIDEINNIGVEESLRSRLFKRYL